MTPDDDEDLREYVVLRNGLGQYSLWLACKSMPAGWTSTGMKGDRQSCMTYVDRVWRDLLVSAHGNQAWRSAH